MANLEEIYSVEQSIFFLKSIKNRQNTLNKIN